ncbi:transposase, partial [Ferrovum sp. JA12]|uniref:transposase n=1 Tax=Ferrovum sp. JA12 TaxID=1356299 RepID=UPI00178CD4AE
MTVTKKSPSPDLIDQLLAGYQKPEDILGEHGLLKQLTKAVVERALQAEMAAHLGHDKHEPIANTAGNARNGTSRKTLKGEFGELPIEIPRDRQSSFEPQLIPETSNPAGQTLTTRFLSLYGRGMT